MFAIVVKSAMHRNVVMCEICFMLGAKKWQIGLIKGLRAGGVEKCNYNVNFSVEKKQQKSYRQISNKTLITKRLQNST